MILGDVEETVTTVEIDEETYEELYKVALRRGVLGSSLWFLISALCILVHKEEHPHAVRARGRRGPRGPAPPRGLAAQEPPASSIFRGAADVNVVYCFVLKWFQTVGNAAWRENDTFCKFPRFWSRLCHDRVPELNELRSKMVSFDDAADPAFDREICRFQH